MPAAPTRPVVPTSLCLVAWVFLGWGIAGVVDITRAATAGTLAFDLGILGFPIAMGLMRLRRPWHTCALIALWLQFFLLPSVLVWLLLGSSGPVPDRMRLGLLLPLLFGVALWQYFVLQLAEVRALFGLPPTADREATGEAAAQS